MQGLLPGSVSKYCLQQSPIPVIVVRPSAKRAKRKQKRLNDPTRRNYNQILELSEARGAQHLLDKANRFANVGELPPATNQEAIAVARALGLPEPVAKVDEGAPLTKVHSARSDATSGPESPSPTGPLSPDTKFVVMKSPELGNLDSPEGSEDDGYEDEKRDKFESQPGRSVGAVVDDDLTMENSAESSSSGGNAGHTDGKG